MPSEPRIRHFVLGENRWREADSWPADANYAAVSAQRRQGEFAQGRWRAFDRAVRESSEPCDVFVYDPEVPVLAPGGPAALSGQFDQAALELGNNVLVYTTEPLGEPLRVFGTPRVVALLRDFLGAYADFTAKLVRVRPNGVAEFICIGIARSSWLFARDAATPRTRFITGNSTLEPTSCCFRSRRLRSAGDRQQRLSRSTTAIPEADVPSCRATSWDWRRSTQIVYHDRSASLGALSAGERERAG